MISSSPLGAGSNASISVNRASSTGGRGISSESSVLSAYPVPPGRIEVDLGRRLGVDADYRPDAEAAFDKGRREPACSNEVLPAPDGE